jgi:choline dehydrogenase-like flavoprotein
MGGSSVLNYMLYVRGNRLDYDIWERDGNPGWGYRDVLHYFKKSEDNRNPYLANTYYHGAGGYLTVQVLILDHHIRSILTGINHDGHCGLPHSGLIILF